MIIREMTDDDVPVVAKLEEETFSMPWHADDFRLMIKDEQMTYMVAVLDGKVVAGAGFRNVVGDGEITNVAVKADYRNKGIGYKLLKELIKKGNEMGASAFTLEVRVSNAPAISLYHKLGFTDSGVRPGFYEKPKEDALIMWMK